MSTNPEVALTLDECVDEVLGLLTGQDLQYSSNFDRYRAIVRQINRALRANALEREWSFYHSLEEIGTAHEGEQDVSIRASIRPRIIGDDSVRLCDPDDGQPRVWAYFLPRDAIEKYPARKGLWVSSTKQSLHFSRPFLAGESGLRIQVPVQREPKGFRLPPPPTDPDIEDPAELEEAAPESVRNQLIDFDYPDVVLLRAAYYVAQSDPLMQPRAQTLQMEFTDMFYALNTRDDRNTDSPFLNDFHLPIQNDLNGVGHQPVRRPYADDRS